MENIGENNKNGKGKGGWITFPFLLGGKFGMTIATGGCNSNLIVFLITKFHVKSVDAALINNGFTGFTALVTVVGAILADTLLGSYLVLVASALLSLLGTTMITVMITVKALIPQPCHNTSLTDCPTPTTSQNAFLYSALTLVSIGNGGSSLLFATMGADQLDNPKLQLLIINWMISLWYFGVILGFTALVYIEDNVSWTLGFGISVAANVISVVFLLFGTPFYRRITPQGSPITSMARVLFASVRKMKLELPLEDKNTVCYYYKKMDSELRYRPPSKVLRFLNRAAMVEGDDPQVKARALEGKSWRLCSVEEVEDFKKIIKLLPIWSAGIFFSVPISVCQSLVVLQALAMDRHLGNHFKIPAGTFVVFSLMSVSIAIIGLDLVFYPLWKRVTGKALRPLTRLGAGHFVNVVSIVGFALIEKYRLGSIRSDHLRDQPGYVTPMSALWLVFPQVVMGIGEALQFPGEVALHYQEFPKSLSNTSASIVSLRVAIAYYVSTGLMGLLQETTTWLPNNINHGRVDCVYWTMAGVAFVNSIYYVTCARFYKYNNLTKDDDAEE